MYKMILEDTCAWESTAPWAARCVWGTEKFLLDMMKGKWLPVLNTVLTLCKKFFNCMQMMPWHTAGMFSKS